MGLPPFRARLEHVLLRFEMFRRLANSLKPGDFKHDWTAGWASVFVGRLRNSYNLILRV